MVFALRIGMVITALWSTAASAETSPPARSDIIARFRTGINRGDTVPQSDVELDVLAGPRASRITYDSEPPQNGPHKFLEDQNLIVQLKCLTHCDGGVPTFSQNVGADRILRFTQNYGGEDLICTVWGRGDIRDSNGYTIRIYGFKANNLALIFEKSAREWPVIRNVGGDFEITLVDELDGDSGGVPSGRRTVWVRDGEAFVRIKKAK